MSDREFDRPLNGSHPTFTDSPADRGDSDWNSDNPRRKTTQPTDTKLARKEVIVLPNPARSRSVHFADAYGDGTSGSGDRLRGSKNVHTDYELDTHAYELPDFSDFFTKRWPLPTTVSTQTLPIQTSTATDETVQTVTEEAPSIPSQTAVVAYLSPLYVNNRTRKVGRTQNTYMPSTSPADIASQFESTRPVSQEEDGLYVGQRPVVSAANQNTMENRVLAEKALHWIDQDWKLKALPDPVCLQGSRCLVEHERDILGPLIEMSTPLLENLDVIGRQAPKRLEMLLEFRGVEFQHHYLFSLEHVYVAKLKELFEGHHALLEDNLSGRLSERIGGLKMHLESLKKKLESGVTDGVRASLKSCIRDLLMTRIQRDDAFRQEQLSLIELVDTWARLKALRAKYGFSSTPHQLVLGSQEREQTLDLDDYQRSIEDELDEREILHTLEAPALVEQYNNEVRQWQAKQTEWENAQQEVDAAIRANRNVLSQEVAHLAAQPEPARPDLPRPFSRREELRLIEERITHSRRRPGDPVFIPKLKTNLPVTDTGDCPADERARRTDVGRQRLFVRVLVNDKEVCRSAPHALTQDFIVTVGKTFTVLVEFVPASMKVEIYEESGFKNRKLAETFIPVPDETATFETADEEAVQFSSPEKMPATHNAVGSGVRSSAPGVDTTTLIDERYTTGLVRWRSAWTDKSAIQIADSLQLSRKHNWEMLGPRGVRDIRKLAEWVQAAKLDPNDPTFAELIHFVKNFEQSPDIKYFRLEQLQQEFDFCTSEDLAANRRFQVLQLRDRQVTDFVDLKMIPPNEDEVPSLLLTEHQKRMKQEASSVLNGGNAKRQQYTRMLQKLREYIAVTVYAAESVHTYEDLVNEEPILTFGKFFEVLMQFWKPKQRLKPTTALRPFVIVRFAGQEQRVQVTNGSNPVWNEQLTFRIHQSLKSSMQFLKQRLEIHFYDEVSVDVLQDDMLRKTHVFQRLDKRFLGSLSFLFTDLYTNSVIEGNFPLSSPPVLLGYTQSVQSSQDRLVDLPSPQASVFITLDPPLTPPTPLPITKLDSIETESVAEGAAIWTAALARQFPERRFQSMVINTEAKSCLITRFVRPLNPPTGLSLETAPTLDKMTSLAKYVAKIPYVSDTLLFPEAVDIWTTNDQFLNLQCGDDEEHALLLVSYFLALKVTSYLLLGNRVTGGSGAYVLSKSGDGVDWLIWDATSGRPYGTNSVNCPLRDVGTIIDASNAWANIQNDGSPRQIQWQLTNSINWKPFFSAKQTAVQEMFSAQPESFTYEEVPFDLKHQLEILLKNQIVSRIMDDRSQYVTRWNIECDRRLYFLLDSMEREQAKTDLQNEHEREIRDLLRIYEIYGFPLNIPFTNADDVTDAILATGVHKIDSNDVEFSLAVNVTSYPHSVISLWVYFAILTKRR